MLFTEVLINASKIKFIGLSFNEDIISKEVNGEMFYIIGNDYEDLLGIRKLDLNVFSISDNDMVFINSSLEQLIDCINCFINSIIDLDEDDFDEEKRTKEVRMVSKKIKNIDKKALLDENYWWSLILEQVEDGLL